MSFWEDNFAWGTGKFSPKVTRDLCFCKDGCRKGLFIVTEVALLCECSIQVMIERQSRHLEGREGELVLQEESSEPLVGIMIVIVMIILMIIIMIILMMIMMITMMIMMITMMIMNIMMMMKKKIILMDMMVIVILTRMLHLCSLDFSRRR